MNSCYLEGIKVVLGVDLTTAVLADLRVSFSYRMGVLRFNSLSLSVVFIKMTELVMSRDGDDFLFT